MIKTIISYGCENYKEYFLIKNYFIKKGYKALQSGNIDKRFKNYFNDTDIANLWISDELKEISFTWQDFPYSNRKHINAKQFIRKIKFEKINK